MLHAAAAAALLLIFLFTANYSAWEQPEGSLP
jgi:hypothetical protein